MEKQTSSHTNTISNSNSHSMLPSSSGTSKIGLLTKSNPNFFNDELGIAGLGVTSDFMDFYSKKNKMLNSSSTKKFVEEEVKLQVKPFDPNRKREPTLDELLLGERVLQNSRDDNDETEFTNSEDEESESESDSDSDGDDSQSENSTSKPAENK